MSASDHLGRQWKQPEITATVYRGLHNVTPKTLDRTNLGMHWTVDLPTAKNFSKYDSYKERNDDYHSDPRTILHGEVPLSSIETDTHTLEQNSASPDLFPEEKEIPVAQRSSVVINKMVTSTKRPNGKVRERTRNYKQPREMKA